MTTRASAAPEQSRVSLYSRLARPIRKNTWGIADQGLIAAANFITTLILARSLIPQAFGIFTVAYTTILFFNSLQLAIVTQPFSIVGATKSGESYLEYVSSIAVMQTAFTVATVTVLFFAVICDGILGLGYGAILTGAALATAGWQVQEFFRRVLYTEGRILAALLNDVISYGGQMVLLLAMSLAGTLTVVNALLAVCMSSIAAAILGGIQARACTRFRVNSVFIRENWGVGKWLVGAQIGYWISGPAYLIVAASILNAAQAAILRMPQVLIGPMNVVLAYLDTILPTRYARIISNGGSHALKKELLATYSVLMPLVLLYCGLVALLATYLIQILFGESYSGAATLVPIYCLYWIMMSAVRPVSSAIRAGRQTDVVFKAYWIASVLAAIAGPPLILVYGNIGALLGMLLTGAVLNAIQWWSYLRNGKVMP